MMCTEVTPVCPVEATLYGYRPNAGGNGFFAAIFTILFITLIVKELSSPLAKDSKLPEYLFLVTWARNFVELPPFETVLR